MGPRDAVWMGRGRQTVCRLVLAGIGFAAAALSQQSGFVGSEMCLSCHPQYASWRETKHATGLKATITDQFSLLSRGGIVSDTDGNGVDDFKQSLDLGRVSPAFRLYGANAPKLGYNSGVGYTIQIGTVTYPVRMAYGGTGSHRQLYVVKIPVGDRTDRLSAGHYLSPVQYNELTQQYSAYRPEFWYDENGQPRFMQATTDLPQEISFERACAGCHFTNVTVKKAGAEWVAEAPALVHYLPDSPHVADMNGDGFKEEVNIGCERCHGPGLAHVLASGGRDTILNPARDLSTEQSNELCGSCHSRGTSLAGGSLAYPFDEQQGRSYNPSLGSDLLSRFFTLVSRLWPDGKESAGYRQQYHDFRGSAKEKAGVRCSTCHDVHGNAPGQLRATLAVRGSSGSSLTIPVSVNDNTQCLACHAGFGAFRELSKEDIAEATANRDRIANVVVRHTNHPYEPEGAIGLSRCTECHMAKMAVNALPYDTASHQFRVVPPESTIAAADQGGMPNSCAVRCHRPWAPIFGFPADRNLEDWTESTDLELAAWLKEYFGPVGRWWRTTPSAAAGAVSRSTLDRGRIDRSPRAGGRQ